MLALCALLYGAVGVHGGVFKDKVKMTGCLEIWDPKSRQSEVSQAPSGATVVGSFRGIRQCDIAAGRSQVSWFKSLFSVKSLKQVTLARANQF